MQENPKYLAAHAYAALAVGGAVRGFLHRRKLEEEGTWANGAAKTPRLSMSDSGEWLKLPDTASTVVLAGCNDAMIGGEMPGQGEGPSHGC
eukprot:scaffold226064_cov14-Tisochrysis_lutea.AAC.2